MAQKEIITIATDKGYKLYKAGKLRFDQLDDTSLYNLLPVTCYGYFTFSEQEFFVNQSTVYPNTYLITHRPTGLAITEKGEPFPYCNTPEKAINTGIEILKRNPEVLLDRIKKYSNLKKAVYEAQMKNNIDLSDYMLFTVTKTVPKKQNLFNKLLSLGIWTSR